MFYGTLSNDYIVYSNISSAVMYGTIGPGTIKRDLISDDEEALRAIYS